MKLHRYAVLGFVLWSLTACYPVDVGFKPLTAEYTSSESPNALTVESASRQFDLRFERGSNRLVPRDAARLRWLAASGALGPSDRVTVAIGGSPPMAAARFDSIAAELVQYGVIASPRTVTGLRPEHAVIDNGRYLVTLPPCPNWSKPALMGYTNTHASNFGCASAVNLGLLVASPADLAGGRSLAAADGQPAAAAVRRYLNDQVQLPTAVTLGPIQASSTAAPGAGAGTGSTP